MFVYMRRKNIVFLLKRLLAQGNKDTARENLGCHIIDFLYDALMYEKIPKQ